MIFISTKSEPIEYTNHTGGAIGSDSMWDEVGREYGVVNHNHYWYGKKNPKSLDIHKISVELYEEGIEMIRIANKTLKRRNIDRYMNLLARNWAQVKFSDSIYAISTISNGKVDGGTGWAVQMGIDNGKDVYVYDQEVCQWYYWNGKFEACNTPVLSLDFAGIGSRKLNNDGLEAIKSVYKKTFK